MSLNDVTSRLAAWFDVPSGSLCVWSHVLSGGVPETPAHLHTMHLVATTAAGSMRPTGMHPCWQESSEFLAMFVQTVMSL